MDSRLQRAVFPEEYLEASPTNSPMNDFVSLPHIAIKVDPEPLNSVPVAGADVEFSLRISDTPELVEDAGTVVAQAPSVTNDPPVRRGRGRPPKYPKFLRDPDAKPLKKRSKDGCITCRRRKKKCDETKPTCLICERSNNICEGYSQTASSSSDPALAKSDTKSVSTPDSSLSDPTHRESSITWSWQAEEAVRSFPHTIHAVENEADRLLLEHYPKLSSILNFPDNFATPFSQVLLDMALDNQGLMHSILYLSGSHLASITTSSDQSNRHWHHLDCALRDMNMQQKLANHFCDVDDHTVDDCTVAQALVIFLSSVIAGQKNGEYRHHMEAAKHLLTCHKFHSEQFQQFSTEFLAYYDFSRNLTWSGRSDQLLSWQAFRIPSFIQREAGTFFGVLNMLFTFMSKITIIRDHIRARRKNNTQPYAEESTKFEARQLDADICNWDVQAASGTPHQLISELYRQCCKVYLYRTILDSRPCREVSDAVDVGLQFLHELGSDQSVQGILLTPIFILGCAAFERRQRDKIDAAIKLLRECRGGGNITPAKAVIDYVWWNADMGFEGKSWDWDFAMERLGMDFIVA